MKQWRFSIKQSITVFILLPVIIAFAAMSLLSYHIAQTILQEQIHEKMSYATGQSAEMLASWFIEKETIITGLAEDQNFVAAVTALSESDIAEIIYPELEKKAARLPGIMDVYLGFPDGSVITAKHWEAPETYSATEKQWYQLARDCNSDDVQYSDVYIDSNTAKPIVTLSYSIRKGSELIAVLGMDVQVDTLQGLVQDIKIGNSGYAILLDGQGKHIYHPEYGPEPENSIMLINDGAYLDYADEFLGGTPYFQEIDVNGNEIFFSSTPVFTTGWALLLNLPASEAFAPVKALAVKVAVVAVICLLLISLVIFLFFRSFLRPIKSLEADVSRVATGNLDIDKKTDFIEDELGNLEKGFQIMAENLKSILYNIVDAAQSLSAYSQQMTASTEQSASALENVGASVAGTASSTEQQMNSVKIISEIIGELDDALQGAAREARRLEELARKAAESSETGKNGAIKTMAQMNCISETTKNVSRYGGELEDSSREIASIVDMITGIAEQTNLLALNAAIEAARAGEHGRGFAVVAEEVRKLAEQTHQSLDKITGLVKKNLENIDKLVKAVQEGNEAVTGGIEDVRETENSFKCIAELVEELSGHIAEIAHTTDNVAGNSHRIVEEIDGIAGLSEKTAAEAQAVSAVVEEQNASIQEIASASNQVAKMAQDLQETTSTFQL